MGTQFKIRNKTNPKSASHCVKLEKDVSKEPIKRGQRQQLLWASCQQKQCK
jgi:hypothetical protein